MKDNKKKNKFVGWLSKSWTQIVCLVSGILVGIFVMFLMWPDRIAKLKDGAEIIISGDDITITADDLYDNMKEGYGLAAILEMVDKNLLNKEYNLADEAKEYAKETSQTYYENYETYYGYSKEEFLSSNGFETEEQFLEYLSLDYLRNTWYTDYLKSLIKDKDIKSFYKNDAFGDKEVYIISSTEEENNLKKVKEALKKGTDIESIVEKYKDDLNINEATITIEDIESYSSKVIKEVKKLSSKKYSDIFEDEVYGQAIIYVKKSEKLGSMDDIKDKIINALSNKLDADDKNLYYKSFMELRDKYGIKFADTSIESEYKKYKKQYK